MPDRTTFFVIAGVSTLLSAVLLKTAYIHELWTEFIVSELQIAACALALLYLLRRSPR